MRLIRQVHRGRTVGVLELSTIRYYSDRRLESQHETAVRSRNYNHMMLKHAGQMLADVEGLRQLRNTFNYAKIRLIMGRIGGNASCQRAKLSVSSPFSQ